MRPALFVAVLLLGTAQPVFAQEIPQQSRTALGEAIRAVLVETPALIYPLHELPQIVATDLYGEDAARDLGLLGRASKQLFSPGLPGFGAEGKTAAIVFFTQDDCPDCAAAEAELRHLAAALSLRVSVFDMVRDAALAEKLGLDMAPSYVLPDMLLRGAMPAIVLEKYLRP
ncbi:hypothetical protein ACSSVY_003742 [Roseovarius sp. MBR-51]